MLDADSCTYTNAEIDGIRERMYNTYLCSRYTTKVVLLGVAETDGRKGSRRSLELGHVGYVRGARQARGGLFTHHRNPVLDLDITVYL